MGVSVSLLIPTSTTTIAVLVGTACFAAGFILSRYFPTLDNNHDDDDDENNNNLGRQLVLKWAPQILTKRRSKKKKEENTKSYNPAFEIENLAEILEDFKMVLVVRNDLKMGKGKIAAQCSISIREYVAGYICSHVCCSCDPHLKHHATLGLYKKLHKKALKALSRWEMCGQVKVVLKIDSEEDMLVLQERAKSLMLPSHIVVDAGRTQIAPNSRTVMAILGPANVVDDVTGGLKLL